MSKGKKHNPYYYNNNKVAVKPSEPVITSFLDIMQDGKEYASIIGHTNVNVDLRSEIIRSLHEIEEIRHSPLICYVANVLNKSVNAISIDNSDDGPFLELLRNATPSENIDIVLVTPGGSAETVAHFVDKIRSKYSNVTFILPYMAMSAGTIFSLSGDDIIMTDNAYIGPIDPQVPGKDGRFVPAQAILKLIDEVRERGQKKIDKGENVDWTDIQLIKSIDGKEIGNAINASNLSKKMVSEYLEKYKFKKWEKHEMSGTPVSEEDRRARAIKIAADLCDNQLWLSHSSRITREMAWDKCRLKITHSESIEGLDRAIRRFWALMTIIMENQNISKMYLSDNYTVFRSQINVEKKS